MLPPLILFIHLSKCLAEEPAQKNAPLTDQLHKSLLKVNAFLAGVQHNIRSQRDALRNFEYEEHTIEQEFFDYTLTSFWWNGTPATGQNTPQTSFLTYPVFQQGIFVTPTKKTSHVPVPEITTKEFSLEPDRPPSKSLPPDYTPSFTFETHPPDYGLSTYNTRDPGPGEYLGPPGEIPETSPQYSVQELATLIRTTPTPSTTPDPRPKGPGFYLPPDQGFPSVVIESTYPSPSYPLVPELQPGDLKRKPYVDISELYPPKTPKAEHFAIVPEVLFTPEVLPIPNISIPSIPSDYNIPDIDASSYPVTFPTQFDQTTEWNSSDPPFPQGHLPSFDHDTQPERNTNDLPFPEGASTPPASSRPAETAFTTLHPNISRHVEEWLKEMPNPEGLLQQQHSYTPMADMTTPDSRPKESLYPEYDSDLPNYMTPNISTPEPPDDRELHIRQGTSPGPGLEGPTATGIQEGIILEDAFGLPYLGTSPTTLESIRTTIVEGRPANIPEGVDFNWATPSTAGDVLMGKVPDTPDPKDEYLEDIYKEMDRLDIGYMSIFLLKITRLIATGKKEKLQPVLMHTEFTLTKIYYKGDLAFLGHPMVLFIMEYARGFTENRIEVLQNLDKIEMGPHGKHQLSNNKHQNQFNHSKVLRYFNNARLAFLGQPLLRVVMNLAMALSATEFDVLQSYASMVHFMLLNRKQTAAVDVNSIMDYADSLYTEEEGEKLILILKDFEEYPNNTMPGKMLCETLVETFMLPHRRLKDSERGQRLIDSVNYAIESRFPHLKDVRRVGDRSSRKFNTSKPTHTTLKSTPTYKRRMFITTSHRKKIRLQKSNQSTDISYKRSHRRSRVIRKLNDHKAHRQSEFNYERMLRRSLYDPYSHEMQSEVQETTATTNVQKRFNIITSDHLSYQVPARTSRATRSPSYVNLVTRPTTDYKLDLRMSGDLRPGFRASNNEPGIFFQKPLERDSRINDRDTTFTNRKRRKPTTAKPREKSFKFRKRNGKPKEARTKLLRMIVEASSYSDEEEALKLNLISAMIHGNRTFRRTEINETMLRTFLEEQKPPRGN